MKGPLSSPAGLRRLNHLTLREMQATRPERLTQLLLQSTSLTTLRISGEFQSYSGEQQALPRSITVPPSVEDLLIINMTFQDVFRKLSLGQASPSYGNWQIQHHWGLAYSGERLEVCVINLDLQLTDHRLPSHNATGWSI